MTETTEKQWRVALDTAAELAAARARIADVEAYARAVTSGQFNNAAISIFNLLREGLTSDILSCEQAPGTSGMGAEWEDGYVAGMQRARLHIEKALQVFTGVKR